jgi:carbonic anhydrase
VEIHFHTPSEHKLRGTEFAGEAHVVHLLGTRYAVIAVLLPAKPNGSPVFDPIFRSLPRNVCASTKISLAWKDLLPESIANYYTYDGSLTTPPCKETAKFYIANNTGLALSNTQRSSLHSLGANARRPLQPINGRPITLVTPR